MKRIRVALVLVAVGSGVVDARRRPAPPDDAEQKVKQSVLAALERSRKEVKRCSSRHDAFVEKLSVTVQIAHQRNDVKVPPRKGNAAFEKCVRDVLQKAVRGKFFTEPHDAVTVGITFDVEMRVLP